MAYQEHVVQKRKDILETAHVLMQLGLSLPAIFNHDSIDDFKGREDDAIIARVPGRLPYREYAFRNDRSKPIVKDVYKEGKVTLSGLTRIYQAIEITDEQAEFDFQGANSKGGRVLAAQTNAVAQGLNDIAAGALADAPYEVVIGGAEQDLTGALVEANRVLTRFRVPDAKRLLIVGSDFEAAMHLDPLMTWAAIVGEGMAEGAAREATLGKARGFTVVSSPLIDSDTAYATVPSAIAFRTGAPAIPEGMVGEHLNDGGYVMRWLKGYDQDHFVAVSTVDTYAGAGAVKDLFMPAPKKATEDTPQSVDPSTWGQYFVRGVKLTLGGSSTYPSQSDKADLVAETEISDAKKWKPRTKEAQAGPGALPGVGG